MAEITWERGVQAALALAEKAHTQNQRRNI
jgi:hypothetical protein